MPAIGCLLLAVALSAHVPVSPAAAGAATGSAAAKLDLTVVFDGARAYERFKTYEALLESDPEHYREELATIRRLERSDVTYVVRIGKFTDEAIEGSLTTDGERIFINVSDEGGVFGEVASLNSRFAHEFEHARQFNDGELAFVKDARTGKWGTAYSSYDIGDELKAWNAQLRLSQPGDHWKSTPSGKQPTLLHQFAREETETAKMQVLVQNGYTGRRLVPNCNVVFPAGSGYLAGQMIRPGGKRFFFGRVYGLSNNPNA